MDVTRIASSEASRAVIESLAVPPIDATISSPEVVAEAVRRGASFLCPTTPTALARAVSEALSGLDGYADETKIEIAECVEALVSTGDLLELPMEDGMSVRRLLFLGPPSFVPLWETGALLVGIRPEGAPIISEELLGAVTHRGQIRTIRFDDRPFVDGLLAEGLAEVQPDHWLKAPREATPSDLMAFYTNRLGNAGPTGEIEGLKIIDSRSRVNYYKGRWRSLKSEDDGILVARRPQAFGAELWCVAQVTGGVLEKLIDLPVQDPLAPAADEAWRLQASIDAMSGHPQKVRTQEYSGEALIDFFGPVPTWARRRLEAVGRLAPRGRGSLFTYAVPSDDLANELAYLTAMMWLSIDDSKGDDQAR